MWVRGLKRFGIIPQITDMGVASYVGAWIETISGENAKKSYKVASYVGAWIETKET